MDTISTDIIATLVNAVFILHCGKFQEKKSEDQRQAFQVAFDLSVDSEKESGIRMIEVLYWAPRDYVQVWTRTTRSVIPVSDLEYDNDGESHVAEHSNGYVDGSTPWKKVLDHDSDWGYAIDMLLREHKDQIVAIHYFTPTGEPWELINVSELSFLTT